MSRITQSQLLKDSKFQRTLTQLSKELGIPLPQIELKAKEYITELYTTHQPIADMLIMQGTQYFLSRGYDKTIDINPSEIKQLTKLVHRYPVAFVTTHKTYIDTFVLALALYRYGLPVPFTFGGINMSFMGFGQIARQAGGIFIRRSFKENYIYKATLRHFIASLVKQKSDFMWAIEGTRSRTGKLVWPKMGILKYIAEAGEHINQEVKYIPVSIVYDLIPDVKAMTEEGRGKDKSPESLWWWINYINSIQGDLGRISLRLGEPLDARGKHDALIPGVDVQDDSKQMMIPRFAFELAHHINRITPVTTTSLVCTALLSKYSMSKRAIDSDVVDLMHLIEVHKPDALVDRSRPIGESVQNALNRLIKDKLVRQQGTGLEAKYSIVNENHLSTTYYANMAVHHFYRRAFIELALAKLPQVEPKKRSEHFWQDIMKLRDLFKFEFFYSHKAKFSDQIEEDLGILSSDWEKLFSQKSADFYQLLEQQHVLVAPVVLYTYIEAYRVVAYGLQHFPQNQKFDEGRFLKECLLLGEELHWQGRIHRLEAVSKPFLQNGIRLAQNYQLIPDAQNHKQEEIANFMALLDELSERINLLQGITLEHPQEYHGEEATFAREIVPGSKTTGLVREILEDEKGTQVAAFFDLDRTLISGFSAKDFFQNRLLSGRMTARELVSQFAGVVVYATGDGNFSGLASIGAQGVKGIKEKVFIEVGEEVYSKHLAHEIYPESRALVSAHLAQGHTVAIVSAATPYQVNPIARDLGIEHVMCTRLEVKKGEFTGQVIEPACWGKGKAIQASNFASEHNIDLSKSYFYTDSAEDLPLLEIVGKPRPLNPDPKLSEIAFKNHWPVNRFDDENRPSLFNMLRTGLAIGSLLPAAVSGAVTGLYNMSWQDGINSMTSSIGDIGSALVGMKLVVRGEENLWKSRPAVFIFNHQSQVDLFIMAKLVRQDVMGVAKKELENTVYGVMLKLGGVVFVDRSNSSKAIEVLKPVVDSLRSGKSLVIAPEGTRSYDYRLGKFKKGAFHIAMQAGIPIVPVMIRNAHDVMPRGASFVKPSAVDIVVMPPIPTADWKVEDIDQHIAEIRQLYLDELGQTDAEEVS